MIRWAFSNSLLAAFSKTAEMTQHAPLLKADGLAAFRAGFSQEAILLLAMPFTGAILAIFVIKDPTDSIRYGKNKPALLKHWMLATYTL